MNKKIIAGTILAIFMLVTISYAAAVNTNATTDIQKKESPLFAIRARKAISEQINEIMDNIKAKFLGERIFSLPFMWIINENNFPIIDRVAMASFFKACTWEYVYTCAKGPQTMCAC